MQMVKISNTHISVLWNGKTWVNRLTMVIAEAVEAQFYFDCRNIKLVYLTNIWTGPLKLTIGRTSAGIKTRRDCETQSSTPNSHHPFPSKIKKISSPSIMSKNVIKYCQMSSCFVQLVTSESWGAICSAFRFLPQSTGVDKEAKTRHWFCMWGSWKLWWLLLGSMFVL